MAAKQDRTIDSGQLKSTQAKSICCTHTCKEILYYCNTCELLICLDCSLGNHKSHDFSTVKDILKLKEHKLSQTLATFKDSCIPLIQSTEKDIEALQKENVKHGQEINQKIKDRICELTDEVNKFGSKLLRENENFVCQNAEYLERIQTGLRKELSEIENSSKDFEDIMINGSDIDKITAAQKAAVQMDVFNSHGHKTKIRQSNFIPGNTDGAPLHKLFGFLDTGVEACSNDVEIVSEFNHRNKNVRTICSMTEHATLLHCTGEYQNDAVTIDGQVQMTLKFDFKINDIAVTTDGHIIAIDSENPYIYKLRMSGVNDMIERTDIICVAELRPVSLCLSSKNKLLVSLVDEFSYDISEKSRRLVSKMTMTGHAVQTYEYNGMSRLFTKPTGIDENGNGDICVVNRTSISNGDLTILDSKGRLKVKYRGGPRNAQFDPVSVKCDKQRRIVVIDWSKKIHLLSEDGQLIQYLMNEKALKHHPWSLAIDKQDLLWVGCDGGKVYVIKCHNK